MLKTNATFDAYNALSSKKPVFVLKIANSAGSGFLTSVFCSGPFADITTDYKKVIVGLAMDSLDFDPTRTDIEPGKCEIDILDKDGDFLAQCASDQLQNRRTVLLYGFQQMNIADFIPINDYYIQEIKYKNKVATIYAEDLTTHLKKYVIRHYGDTQSTEALNHGEEDIQVEDESSFNVPVDTTDGYMPWGDSDLTTARSHAALLINANSGKNWVRYHNIDVGVIYVGPTIGISGDWVNNRNIVEQMWCTSFFYGAFLLQLLTTTSAGTNGNWDIGIEDWGLELPASKIDEIQIVNEMVERYCKWAEEYANERPSAFMKRNALDGIEKMTGFDLIGLLLAALPAKMFFTENCKLGIKLLDPFGTGEGICDITDDDLVGSPTIEWMRSGIVSQVDLIDFVQQAGDCTPIETKYKHTIADLMAQYEDMGVRTIRVYQDEYPQILQREKTTQRIFGVLGEPIVRLILPLKLKWITLQPADLVNVTISNVANMFSGQYGVTNVCFRVIKNNIRFKGSQAYCECELFNISLGQKETKSFVSLFLEDTIDTLEASTDAQKEMTEDADVTASLESEDAYIDIPVLSQVFTSFVGVYVRLTLPNEAGGSSKEYITIHIHSQDIGGTDDHVAEKRIYYDETASGEQITDMYLVFDFPTHKPARIKVDWENHSGTYPPTKVEVIGYKMWYFEDCITQEVI